MILNSIMIENIRSYNEEIIDFPRGITLFEGDIGSGKSTILMGIEFALFGLGSEKADALLAKKADQGSITLNFSVDEKNYEIKRTLKRSSTSISQDAKNTYIKIGDEKEPLSPAELKQRVLQILKFNEPGGATAVSKIFRYAVFTPQEEMKQVLSDTEKRLETIRRAFSVEDYKTATENASKVLTELNVQIVRFEERTRGIEDFEKNIGDANEQILKIKIENNEAEKIKAEKESEEKKIESDLEKYDTKIKKKTKLESDLEACGNKIQDKNRDLKEIKNDITNKTGSWKRISAELKEQKKIKKPTIKSMDEIEDEIKKFEKIDGDITETQKEIKRLSDMLKVYDYEKIKNEKPEILEKEKDEFDKELEKIRKTSETNEEKKKKLEKTLIQNETNQGNLEKEVAKFAKIGSQCPYCESQITKEHLEKLETERKEKLEDVKKILKKNKMELQKKKSEQEELERKEEIVEEKYVDVLDVLTNLSESKVVLNELQPIESKMNDLLKQNTVTREKGFMCDSGKPLEYLTELKGALINFENSQKISDGLEREQGNAKKDLESYEKKRIKLEGEIKITNKELKEISNKIELYEGLYDEIDVVKGNLVPVRKAIKDQNDTLAQNRVRLKK